MAEANHSKETIFRKRSADFCSALISHPGDCCIATLELYAKEYISKEVKDDVLIHSKSGLNMQVAASIQNSLAVKLKIDPDCWDGMLQVLSDKCEPLRSIIQKMKKDVRIYIPLESRQEIEDHQTKVVENVRNQVESDDELAPRIAELNREFRILLGRARSGLDSERIDDIKLIITAAFNNSSRRDSRAKCMEDLKKVETINDIIHFLLTENICDYFNFALLAEFIKNYGDVVSKRELKAYEQKFHEFAKTAKLLQLIKLYKNFNPHQVIGFPVEIVYTMNTECWGGNTWNTFLEITNHYLPSVRGIMCGIIEKSIVITYSVFPEDVDNVKRDLEQNKTFLQDLGITTTLHYYENNIPDTSEQQEPSVITRDVNEDEHNMDMIMSENVMLKNKVAALQRKNETVMADNETLKKRNRKTMDDYKIMKKLYETQKKRNEFETMKIENDTLKKQNRNLMKRNQTLKKKNQTVKQKLESIPETRRAKDRKQTGDSSQLSSASTLLPSIGKLGGQDSPYASKTLISESAVSLPQVPKEIKAPATVSRTRDCFLSKTHQLINEVYNAPQPRKKPYRPS